MARERDDEDRPARRSDGPSKDIPNNLIIAILAIFCCWPLAIVAIVKAASVNGLVAQEKYTEAEKASADAKKFAMISIVIGIVGYVIYGIVMIVGIVAAGAAAN